MKRRILITGAKETFLIRVLKKKITEADIECVFTEWQVNNINDEWEGTGLIIIYMDDGFRPDAEVTRFLIDKMTDEGNQVIAIGEKNDVAYIKEKIPDDMMYAVYERPVDTEKFIAHVEEYFDKVASGEFRKSILIVDDDPSYLGLVREWLKGKYKVSMANSGLQAIKFLGKNKADLILLDHEMPVTTGPQVLEMLRSEEETKDIPVIFLTGKSDKESVMAVVALKPEGYFLKNISKEELLEKLDEFFVLHKK